MNPTNTNNIWNIISAIAPQIAQTPPQVNLPPLDISLPSGVDLQTMYQQFLNRAANDPDIVHYYSQLLDQAKGDVNIAQNFLEQDYQTGVRNVQQNVGAGQAQEAVTQTQENQNLQNNLNQRGIALTQNDNGTLTYAGGGQSATEVGQQATSQQLRQEALTRSANQQLTGLSQNLQQGLTATGQQLAGQTQNINQQKQSDIANRAGSYFNMYLTGQQGKQNQALQTQQNQTLQSKPYWNSNLRVGR